MDSLPPELVAGILSYIVHDKQDRISAQCVCRRFHQIIDRTHKLSFNSLSITDRDLSAFKACFSDQVAYRRDTLLVLTYQLQSIPNYLDTQNEMNDAFTKQILGLLHVLSSWEYSSCGLELELRPCIPKLDKGDIRVRHLRLEEANNKGTQVCVPQVSRITIFTVRNNQNMQIEPATITQLAGSMPNLQQWETTGLARIACEEVSLLQHQQMRTDFGQTLLKLSHIDGAFNNLKEISLMLNSPKDIFQFPCEPDIETDLLSIGLHTFSRLPHLQKLELNDLWYRSPPLPLSSAFFWPNSLSSNDIDPGPMWPSLEILRVEISTRTPSGGSYLKKDGNPRVLKTPLCTVHGGNFELFELDDQFQLLYDPETFTSLMLSLGKSMMKMEKLSESWVALLLQSNDYEPNTQFFGCEYMKAGYTKDYVDHVMNPDADTYHDPEMINTNRCIFWVEGFAMWNALDDDDALGQQIKRLFWDIVGSDGILKVKVMRPSTYELKYGSCNNRSGNQACNWSDEIFLKLGDLIDWYS